MKLEINVLSESIDSLTSDVLTLGFFSNERPPRGYCGFADWRLNGVISRLMAKGKIGGAFLEKVLIQPGMRIPCEKVLLIGMGDACELTYEKLYSAGQNISKTLKAIRSDDLVFDIPGIGRCSLDASKMASAMMAGFFDYLAGNTIPSDNPLTTTYILGFEQHLAEIILGMHKFKVDVKNRASINIREIKK